MQTERILITRVSLVLVLWDNNRATYEFITWLGIYKGKITKKFVGHLRYVT